MSRTICYSDELLRQLIDAEDAAGGEPARIEHLDDCARCQRRLEDLAADRRWWADSGQFLRQGDSLPPASFVSNSILIERSPPRGNAEAGAVWDEVPATFLDAPSHPEMLGRLDGYEIERVIGRGGMGIVLKGFDTELHRPVAIKVLAPHLAANGAARQRFAREARAAAAIVQENVLAIHGIQSSGPLPYLVMPYVAGGTLQTFVDRHGPLDVKDIVRIAMQIARGLAAAHRQGLVHRDVKPGNVLLENGINRVLITDFGLARLVDDVSLTRSGVITGTPEYMSPEQADGRAIDYRSDLFGLGSVIYFMATGHPPFRAPSIMAVLNRICHATQTDLRQLNPDVPRPLAEIVQRLLQKRPADRFESAREVHDVLAECLAYLQQPGLAKPPRIRHARNRRRRRVWLGIAAASVAVLCGACGLWSMRAGAPHSTKSGARPPVIRPDALADLTRITPPEVLDKELTMIRSGVKSLETELSHQQPATCLTPWSLEMGEVEAGIRQLEGRLDVFGGND
jgi:serine/threonine protein kinase